VSPAQTGFHSRVVCGTLTLSSRFLRFLAYLAIPTHPGRPLTLAAPHSPWAPSSRWYPHSPRLQALASDFLPVLGGSIVRTGDKSDPKRVVAYAGRTPAVTGRPDDSSLPWPGRWSRLAREFVARQPVAAFRSPVVCGSLTFATQFLTNSVTSSSPTDARLPSLAKPLPSLPHSSAVPPHSPGCKRLHLTFSPSQGDRPSGREKTQIVRVPARSTQALGSCVAQVVRRAKWDKSRSRFEKWRSCPVFCNLEMSLSHFDRSTSAISLGTSRASSI